MDEVIKRCKKVKTDLTRETYQPVVDRKTSHNVNIKWLQRENDCTVDDATLSKILDIETRIERYVQKGGTYKELINRDFIKRNGLKEEIVAGIFENVKNDKKNAVVLAFFMNLWGIDKSTFVSFLHQMNMSEWKEDSRVPPVKTDEISKQTGQNLKKHFKKCLHLKNLDSVSKIRENILNFLFPSFFNATTVLHEIVMVIEKEIETQEKFEKILKIRRPYTCPGEDSTPPLEMCGKELTVQNLDLSVVKETVLRIMLPKRFQLPFFVKTNILDFYLSDVLQLEFEDKKKVAECLDCTLYSKCKNSTEICLELQKNVSREQELTNFVNQINFICSNVLFFFLAKKYLQPLREFRFQECSTDLLDQNNVIFYYKRNFWCFVDCLILKSPNIITLVKWIENYVSTNK